MKVTGRERKDTTRTRRRQLHTWLSDDEYALLLAEAEAHDKSVSGAMRRAVRLLAAHGKSRSSHDRASSVSTASHLHTKSAHEKKKTP